MENKFSPGAAEMRREREAKERLTNAALELYEALEVSNDLIGKVQAYLAEWIVPDSGISDHDVLNSLLGLLDGSLQRKVHLQTEDALRKARGE